MYTGPSVLTACSQPACAIQSVLLVADSRLEVGLAVWIPSFVSLRTQVEIIVSTECLHLSILLPLGAIERCVGPPAVEVFVHVEFVPKNLI